MVFHEMLHSCSCSHYDPPTYSHNQYIEESSVEFLKQQVCKEKGIKSMAGYVDFIEVLENINQNARFGTNLAFANELFNVPLPERYEWLENKVIESLRKENASLQEYEEIMSNLTLLRDGEKI